MVRTWILALGTVLFPALAVATPISVAGFNFDAGEAAFADDAFLVSGTIRSGSPLGFRIF